MEMSWNKWVFLLRLNCTFQRLDVHVLDCFKSFAKGDLEQNCCAQIVATCWNEISFYVQCSYQSSVYIQFNLCTICNVSMVTGAYERFWWLWHVRNLYMFRVFAFSGPTELNRLPWAMLSVLLALVDGQAMHMNVNKVENICSHGLRCLLPQVNTALSILFMFWVSKQSSRDNMIFIL